VVFLNLQLGYSRHLNYAFIYLYSEYYEIPARLLTEISALGRVKPDHKLKMATWRTWNEKHIFHWEICDNFINNSGIFYSLTDLLGLWRYWEIRNKPN